LRALTGVSLKHLAKDVPSAGAFRQRSPGCILQRGAFRIPQQPGGAQEGVGPAKIGVGVRSEGPLVAVLHRVGKSGVWKYVADVVSGSTSVSIPLSEFPPAEPGEAIPIGCGGQSCACADCQSGGVGGSRLWLEHRIAVPGGRRG
jgi:hypothetical protein